MSDSTTPRCPHCANLTVVGSIAGRLVAVCTHCDNGFAVAAQSFSRLSEFPAQQVTRAQLEQAVDRVMSHLGTVASTKQDDLLAQEAALPEDRAAWTEAETAKAANCQSQRMMFAGVLQGASSFREMLGKAVGLPAVTLSGRA